MAKHAKDLKDLFHDTLKDIYFTEKQILRALPKMAKAAQSEELRRAFETHHDETESQIERLDQVFEIIGKSPQGKTCEAIMGIIDEARRSSRISRRRMRWTPACWPPLRQSSTTKSVATGR